MITIPKIFNINGVQVKIHVAEAQHRLCNIPFGTSSIKKDYIYESKDEFRTGIIFDSNKQFKGQLFYHQHKDLKLGENWHYETWFLADSNIGYSSQSNRFVSDKLTDDHFNKTFNIPYMNSTDATAVIPSGFLAADYCKSKKLAIPTIGVLARIYQNRQLIDSMDDTLSNYPNLSIDNMLLESLNIWSSTIGDANHAWVVRTEGRIGYARLHYPASVIPVYEELI